MRILVTGGTVFVTGRIAEYFVAKGCEVYVLNRNTRQQPDGVKLIEADRLFCARCFRFFFGLRSFLGRCAIFNNLNNAIRHF